LPKGDAIVEALLGGASRTSSGWDLMGNMRLMIVPRWLLYPMALLCGMVGVGAAEMVHVVNRTMPPNAPMPKLMWNSPANLQPTRSYIDRMPAQWMIAAPPMISPNIPESRFRVQ
jgi:hypothetical protein